MVKGFCFTELEIELEVDDSDLVTPVNGVS